MLEAKAFLRDSSIGRAGVSLPQGKAVRLGLTAQPVKKLL